MIDRIWSWGIRHNIPLIAGICYEIVWIKDKLTRAS